LPLRDKIDSVGGGVCNKINPRAPRILKTQMKQVDDPTFGTYRVCKSCDWSKEHGCWGKTVEFCEKKGLEWNTLTEILNHLSGFAYNIACDADVLNRLPVKGESENTPGPDVPNDGNK
jgi:hypothetical protein